MLLNKLSLITSTVVVTYNHIYVNFVNPRLDKFKIQKLIYEFKKDETETENIEKQLRERGCWILRHKKRTESDNKTVKNENRDSIGEATDRAMGGWNPRSTTLIFQPKLLCV